MSAGTPDVDPSETARILDSISRSDVLSVRSADGFWLHLSSLDDGSWVVEYDRHVTRDAASLRLVGPWGVSVVLPAGADPASSLRGLCGVILGGARDVCSYLAAVSAGQILAREIPESLTLTGAPLDGVSYVLPDGLTGMVSGEFFITEDGEVLPLFTMQDAWPMGARFGPGVVDEIG